MTTPPKRRRGAPKGNRNSVIRRNKLGTYGAGLRGSLYLNVADLSVLDDYLASQGITPDNKARLQAARDIFHAALRAVRDKQDEPPIII